MWIFQPLEVRWNADTPLEDWHFKRKCTKYMRKHITLVCWSTPGSIQVIKLAFMKELTWCQNNCNIFMSILCTLLLTTTLSDRPCSWLSLGPSPPCIISNNEISLGVFADSPQIDMPGDQSHIFRHRTPLPMAVELTNGYPPELKFSGLQDDKTCPCGQVLTEDGLSLNNLWLLGDMGMNTTTGVICPAWGGQFRLIHWCV